MTTMSKNSAMSDTMRGTHQFALSGENGQVLARATETWLTATVECQREFTTFVSTRLGKDSETLVAIMGCKNPADATAILSRCIEETLRDYSAEMAKLMSLYSKLMDVEGRAKR